MVIQSLYSLEKCVLCAYIRTFKNETICLKSDKINIIYLGDIITPEEILNGKLIYFDKNMDKKDIYKSKFIINKKNLRKIKCDAGRPLRI